MTLFTYEKLADHDRIPLIHAASQTPYQLQATAPIFANSSLRCIGDFLTRSFQVRHLLGCAGSGLPSLGLPVLLPNHGVLVVMQDSVR